METPVRGGYHWQSAAHVSEWLANLPNLGPERAAAFEAILRLLPADTDAPLSFLDLGAGAGGLTSVLLARYPRSSAVLVDFSEPMMQAGAEALATYTGRFHYVVYDMNASDWPADLAGPFDAVVSSQAIHHLPNERKAWLFGQVHGHLAPGGVFANWDPFRKPEHDDDSAASHHDRTLATIDEACAMLRQAGFVDVAVPHQTADSALISAKR